MRSDLFKLQVATVIFVTVAAIAFEWNLWQSALIAAVAMGSALAAYHLGARR